MKRIYAGLAGLAAVLTFSSCSTTPEDQLSHLLSAIDSGEECPELFPLLKAIPDDEPAATEAQAEMRNIGCYTVSSERTDAERSAIDPSSDWIGVPGGKRVVASNDCLDIANQAATMNEVDFEAGEQLIEQSLDICQDTNEWLSAVAEYPGLMGMVEGYIPSVSDVQIACSVHPKTEVCTDFRTLEITE